jgi:cysteinyl-tRNA synthetase
MVTLVFGFLGIAFATPKNASSMVLEKANENGISNAEVTEKVVEDTEQKVKEAKPEYAPRSEKAKEHMSEVAKVVEELVRSADRMEDPGIGEQVREIAKAQGDSEDKINEAIDKAEGRGALLKFVLGPNWGELKEAKKEMQQNEVRIKELNRLMEQVQNESDRQALQEQIKVLEEQNTQLSDNLEKQTEGFSLLGWLFKWINKY